ncbi:MAG: putative amidohydrolase [Methylophagaceae bacterium]|jgi:predicted amidohydrolase
MNSSGRLKDNVAFAKAKIEQAADQGLDLVSFPETFI